MSNTPSLRELLDFADAFDWNGWAEPKNAQAAFAKAVLAKWGTPQPVVREPLTDEGIEQATGAKIGTPLFLAAKGFVLATESAHGITQQGGQ